MSGRKTDREEGANRLIMALTVTAVYAIATAWFQPYKETTETVLQLQVRSTQL